jgi:hypothetical protein
VGIVKVMSKMRLPPTDGPGPSAKILPFRPVTPPVVETPMETKADAPRDDQFHLASGPAALPASPVAHRTHPLLMTGIMANGQTIPMASSLVAKPVLVAGQPTIQGDVELNSKAALRAFSGDVMVVTGSLTISDVHQLNNVDLLKLSGLVTVGGRFEVEGL